MKSTRVFLGLASLVFVSLVGACEESRPEKLCIEGSLGQFALQNLGAEGRGCRAEYGVRGALPVRVLVKPLEAGWLGRQGEKTRPFEKHHIFIRDEGKGQVAAWNSVDKAIEVRMPGKAEAFGPVLRAYLFRYPSGVEDRRKRIEQDVEKLRQASREAPREVAVHLNLARSYRKLNNTVMAAHEYHICIDIDPEAYDCLLEMGTMYRKLRHWDLSIRALLRAAKLRPEAWKPHMELGDVYYICHNRSGAMAAYGKAIAESGLPPEDEKRAVRRLAELKAGKFQGEVLPGQNKLPGQ